MKRIIVAIALFILGATSSTISAHGIHGPHHKHKVTKMQKRIYHGVQTGQLTPKEMAHLQMQQAKIHHDKRCAKADGIVTPRERTYIHREQARASRHIYHQKHDGQRRF